MTDLLSRDMNAVGIPAATEGLTQTLELKKKLKAVNGVLRDVRLVFQVEEGGLCWKLNQPSRMGAHQLCQKLVEV